MFSAKFGRKPKNKEIEMSAQKNPLDEFAVHVSSKEQPLSNEGVDAPSNVALGFSAGLKPASRKDLQRFRSVSPAGSSGWKLRGR